MYSHWCIERGVHIMRERVNVEIAHELTHSEYDEEKHSRQWLIEVAEAVGLSLIAVATAWCGYHAAKWDGRQAYLYGQASRLRV